MIAKGCICVTLIHACTGMNPSQKRTARLANSEQNPIPVDEQIMSYARFGVILKLYRGSTNPYIADGGWRQHPTKEWEEVADIIRKSPLHGAKIEKGYLDDAEYQELLTNFQVQVKKIVDKMNDDGAWKAIEAEADAHLHHKVDLHLNPDYPYGDITYDHADMKRHWEAFDRFSRSRSSKIRLTNTAIRDRYACYAVVASFSRGVADRFYIRQIRDANGNIVAGPRSLCSSNVNTYFEGCHLTRVILGARDYPEFNEVRQCGNFACHGLTHLNEWMDSEHYIFCMLNIRKALTVTLHKLQDEFFGRYNLQEIIDSPNGAAQEIIRNNAILKYLEDGLARLNSLSGSLGTFKDYDASGNTEIEKSKRSVWKFKQTVKPAQGLIWNNLWYLGQTPPPTVADNVFNRGLKNVFAIVDKSYNTPIDLLGGKTYGRQLTPKSMDALRNTQANLKEEMADRARIAIEEARQGISSPTASTFYRGNDDWLSASSVATTPRCCDAHASVGDTASDTNGPASGSELSQPTSLTNSSGTNASATS